jgi:hypothetical protein
MPGPEVLRQGRNLTRTKSYDVDLPPATSRTAAPHPLRPFLTQRSKRRTGTACAYACARKFGAVPDAMPARALDTDAVVVLVTEATRSTIGHEAANFDAVPERRIRRDVGEIEGRMGREASDPVHLRVVLLED